MSNIVVNERDIVIPGEVLAEGMDYLPGDNTYREDDKICAMVLGLTTISGRVIRLTPLGGPYVPKIGDKIIGRVTDITLAGWRVETGTAYSSFLNVKDASTRFIRKDDDLRKILAIGDSVVAMIINVTSQFLIDLTMKEPDLHKVQGGRIIIINSQKVPRVIGKQGSMVTIIKQITGCDITVGQNGRVWIKGTPEGELLAEKAIKLIEEKSYIEGLTEKVQQFLESKSHGI